MTFFRNQHSTVRSMSGQARWGWVAAFVGVLSVAGAGAWAAWGGGAPDEVPPTVRHSPAFDAFLDRLAREPEQKVAEDGRAEVQLRFSMPDAGRFYASLTRAEPGDADPAYRKAREKALNARWAAESLRRRAAIREALAEFMAKDHIRWLRDYSLLPVLYLEVDAVGLAALQALAGRELPPSAADGAKAFVPPLHLGRVVSPPVFTPSQATPPPSVVYTGAVRMRNAGYDGEGIGVAVMDTGVKLSVAGNEFGSDCRESGGGNDCALVVNLDLAQSTSPDAALHGNNVCAIVHRMAPKAWILSYNVFNAFVDPNGGPSQFYVNGQALGEAFNRAWESRADWEIKAINMSLGDSRQSVGFCGGGEGYEDAFISMFQAGALFSVASGNDGYKAGIGSPACVFPGLAVGALAHQNGEVTQFSNMNNTIALVAPGTGIDGGGVTNFTGTSMAAPHAAGGMALLAQYLARAGGTAPSAVTGARLSAQIVLEAFPLADKRFGDAEWRFPALRLAGEPFDEVIEVVTVDAARRLEATGTAFPFSLNAPNDKGLEALYVGVWAQSEDPSQLRFDLARDDGSSKVSATLTKGMGRNVVTVLGRIMAPDFAKDLYNKDVRGRWVLTVTDPLATAASRFATMRRLFVAVDYKDPSAPIKLTGIDLKPENLDLRDNTAKVELRTDNPNRTRPECKAKLSLSQGAATESGEPAVQPAFGNGQAATVSGKLPQLGVNGRLKAVVKLECPGWTVNPDTAEAAIDVNLKPVKGLSLSLVRPFVNSTNYKALAFTAGIDNTNPFPVACAINFSTGLTGAGATVRYSPENGFAPGPVSLNGSVEPTPFTNGQKLQLKGTLDCGVVPVEGSLGPVAYTMVDEAKGDFTFAPARGPAPLKVTFTAQVDGQADRVRWDFGDLSTGEGAGVEHTYSSSGRYSVQMTLINPVGQTRVSKADAIVVDEPGTVGPGDTDAPADDDTPGLGSEKGCAGAGSVGGLWAPLGALLGGLALWRRRRRGASGARVNEC